LVSNQSHDVTQEILLVEVFR